MSLLSDFREDMRLARLNNPGYGVLFTALDIFLGLFKLILFAAFGLGIWHIIYGISAFDNYEPLASARSKLADVSVEAPDITGPDVAALTPERIEMLRKFALESRQADEASTDTMVALTNSPIINQVQMPAVFVDQNAELVITKPSPEMKVAGELIPLPVDVPGSFPGADGNESIELKSAGVFETLEKKLQQPDSKAADTLPEPTLESSEALAPPVASTDPLVAQQAAAVIADNGGINEHEWVLAQNPDHYTIQIGSTENRPFLVRFARLLPKGQPVAIYHYAFRDKPEYGLSYGLFGTKDDANKALGLLSQKVRRYGAFSRKLSIVHQQIEQLSEQVALVQK